MSVLRFEDDKDVKNINFLPVTDIAMDLVIQGKGSWETDAIQKGIKMHHRQAFMEKAFPAELEEKNLPTLK